MPELGGAAVPGTSTAPAPAARLVSYILVGFGVAILVLFAATTNFRQLGAALRERRLLGQLPGGALRDLNGHFGRHDLVGQAQLVGAPGRHGIPDRHGR